MLARFLPLLICAVSMYGGCQLFKINDGRTNEATKLETKTLCEKGEKAVALLRNEYTEMKVAGSKTFLYEFDYEVDGASYPGKISKNEELSIPIVSIIYDPDNPSVHTTNEDPCASYAAIKDNAARWPDWFEYAGIGLFLLGLVFAKSSVLRVFSSGEPAAA